MIDLFGIRKRRLIKIEDKERRLRIRKNTEDRKTRKAYLYTELTVVIEALKTAVDSNNKKLITLHRQERDKITEEISEL